MIYDCFTFFNELDLLEVRLNVLYDYVDKFIIVEGNKTHSGKDKELILEKNLKRYEKFTDKIMYIKVEDFPELDSNATDSCGNNWLYENFQRDAIMRGLTECKPEDIVIISDLDEIPKPECIKKYKSGICSFVLLNMYYKFNCINISDLYQKKAKICRYKDLIDPKQDIGNLEYCRFTRYGLPTYLRFCKGKKFRNAGWHFSYLADVKGMLEKRIAQIEQHYNTEQNMNIEKMEKIVEEGKDILERDAKYENLKLSPKIFPKYLIDNREKFAHLIGQKNQISFAHALFDAFMYKNCAIRYKGGTIHGQRYFRFFGLKFNV